MQHRLYDLKQVRFFNEIIKLIDICKIFDCNVFVHLTDPVPINIIFSYLLETKSHPFSKLLKLVARIVMMDDIGKSNYFCFLSAI